MGRWMLRLGGLLIVTIGGASGCVPNPPGERESAELPAPELSVAPPVVSEASRLYADGRGQCRFPVPVTDFQVTARHFEPTGPIHQIRHQLSLSLGGSPAVRIDVWDDPQARPIARWAEQTLSFLLDESRAATSRRVTAWDVEGLILEQPASPQTHPRITALAAAGGRVFRITCLRAHDPRARAAFERIVAELEPEVAP
ncbi:MAG: hypothetical protein JRI68_26550 [Deltaproteobacteria bacterium]|nr:hypothetical protein [Deltaproteobacteria bacterium]